MDARIKSGHDEFVCVHTNLNFQTAIETVIASEAKQSSFLSCRAMDCFASLAMTAEYDFAFSPRIAPKFCYEHPALFDQRAQGMPGARCAR
jgi:hypothetical protein